MLERPVNNEIIEENKKNLLNWISTLSKGEEGKEISRDEVKNILESCGADLNIDEEKKEKLRGYSEKKRVEVMGTVWGNEKFEAYKNWIKEYIVEYEEKTDIELPVLVKQKDSKSKKPSSRRKNSGMVQFLGDLTSYASGAIDFNEFEECIGARSYNGLAWKEGRKEERRKIKVPTSEKKIRPASFPPEFPKAAFEFLSS
jgi:hypothetical protein